MPYISKEARGELDSHIEALSQQIINTSDESACPGMINYCCTRLALSVLQAKTTKLRYWHVALITGIFHNIADEFYRRVGHPYEDFCIGKNGDVDEYASISKLIEELSMKEGIYAQSVSR